MTEKYILIEGGVKDTANGITWDSFLELVLVLNGQSRQLQKLSVENEQLKQDGGYWAETAEARRKEIDKLKEENEQLKQTNQKLYDDLQETIGYLALKSGIEQENEQLKSEIREVRGEYEQLWMRL